MSTSTQRESRTPTGTSLSHRMLTRDDTAAYLAISTRTVDRLVRAGELPTYRISGHRRFRIEDVDSFIESRKEEI